MLFSLLKERPVLDHHAKAHIHEIQWISGEIWWISYRFHEISWISGEIWQISYGFQVKSSRFQVWNLPDFKRPIARNGKPYVSVLVSGKIALKCSQITTLVKIHKILIIVSIAYILVYLVNTGSLVCLYSTYHVLKYKSVCFRQVSPYFSIIWCIMLPLTILYICLLNSWNTA